MSIFKKTNAPYLVSGALAIGTLLASGIFAVAPYVAFLAPVAALSLGLPFIIGGAIFSVAVIALSAVAISKNSTISQQEKFENLVAARKKEEANERAELKAKGLLPDIIELPYKLSSVPDVIALPDKNFESRVAKRKQEEENARAELKAEGLLPDVIELPYKLSSVPDIIALPDTETETPSPKSQPTKEEKSQSMGALGKVTAGAVRWAAIGAGVGAVIGGVGAGVGAVIGGVGALKDVYYDNCTKSNTPTKLDEVKASSMDNGACLGLQM